MTVVDVCESCGINLCAGQLCEKCMEAYHQDMAAMEQPPLYEAYGDVPVEVCPVCEERPVDKDMRTCLDTGCREQWSMAWAK